MRILVGALPRVGDADEREKLDHAIAGSAARQAEVELERLADLVGVGFSLVSTGPVRDETILVGDSPLTRWYPALRSALPEH